jgi:deoxyribodipyrimidine photo-lyase
VDERGGALGPGLGQARCLDATWGELAERGWITNQQRMWLASHWSVREGRGWRDGEDLLFRQLLDGSRAANRIGWQWTVGALTGKAYGFSRWQVEKRAPSLCRECPLALACPIQDWPPEQTAEPELLADPRIRRDLDLSATRGPGEVQVQGRAEVVWLTAESLGDGDPALMGHPDLPAAFVFDLPLLRSLNLSSTRLVFLAETLADLAGRRELSVYLGDPVEILQGRPLATTFAPVPGWRRRAPRLDLAAIHPWPWLLPPHDGPVASFTAWATRAGKKGQGSRRPTGTPTSKGRVSRTSRPG